MTETNLFYQSLHSRILVLDGAMGTMIQQYRLTEEDYRGERFASHSVPVKGNNDLLVLARPDIIREIHEKYLEAGADLIETDTFNAQAISLADYGMQELAYEINLEASKIAKAAAEKFNTSEKPRFVAGSIGPTNKTTSMSPDVNDPGYRAVSFKEMAEAYASQVRGLIDGGCDVLLVETIFDTLNAKACLFAIRQVYAEKGIELPVMISVTITDASGRTLSGQTAEAFLISMSHFPMVSVGLNCALGARQIKPFLEDLSEKAPFYISVYPNAGLPNQFGSYDETPLQMADIIREFVSDQLVNVVGGCCGTSPEHIRLMAELVKGAEPRKRTIQQPTLKLSGLEPLVVRTESNFINIGERTNVAGSMKFARLIREKKYEEALAIARQQIENGAQIIDVNLDDGLLDARQEMETFLRLVSSDPDIARVPVMIDSSKWEVIETGLQNLQGKAIVNSISLKEGEQEFLRRAQLIRNYGAATVVMAFDEEGQAATFEKKIAVCKRAYDLLVNHGFPAEDIVFDANILTIGTGIQEHNPFAQDFIRAVKWIRENLPLARTSGGVSNLSFAFRGNEKVRAALHAVFLYHAVNAGLDMGIVNAGALPVYEDIESGLRSLCEDLILNKRKDATDRLLTFAENLKEEKEEASSVNTWRNLPLKERLIHSLVKGVPDFVDADVDEALKQYPQALTIIEGPLMEGMNRVGDLFSSGRMFLPQVMKSARVMKKAVAILQPVIEAQNKAAGESSKAGKVMLATVKGDVHDIGKNIVGVVLACNNYEIIDLGIMIPKEKIIEEAIRQEVDIIGLSGLITPSLDEMTTVAAEMEKQKLNIPLLIGGATTSKIHTAVKIAPSYSGPVYHVKDASRSVGLVSDLLNEGRKAEREKIRLTEYEQLREEHRSGKGKPEIISQEEALQNRFVWTEDRADVRKPVQTGIRVYRDLTLEELIPLIDWTFFFHQWRINGKYPAIFNDPVKGKEAKKLFEDAQELLSRIVNEKWVVANAVAGIFPAFSEGNHVIVRRENGTSEKLSFLRNTEKKDDGVPNLCLADYIAGFDKKVEDYMGFFAVTAGLGTEKAEQEFKEKNDDYSAIMLRILADRLAEAAAEWIHREVRVQLWGYSPGENLSADELLAGKYRGIRPAPGYPACPVHSEKAIIFRLLEAEENTGISLTENFAMNPAASVCGYIFAHPEANYFAVNS